MIRLELPYPLSANVYWRSRVIKSGGTWRAMTYVSSEAVEYKRQVAAIARATGIVAPLQGRVQVHIELYPARPKDWAKRQRKDPAGWDDSVRCIDLDNARKVLYDALKGVLFEDDDRIFRDSAERMEPDGDVARVVVHVSSIVDRRWRTWLQWMVEVTRAWRTRERAEAGALLGEEA